MNKKYLIFAAPLHDFSFCPILNGFAFLIEIFDNLNEILYRAVIDASEVSEGVGAIPATSTAAA